MENYESEVLAKAVYMKSSEACNMTLETDFPIDLIGIIDEFLRPVAYKEAEEFMLEEFQELSVRERIKLLNHLPQYDNDYVCHERQCCIYSENGTMRPSSAYTLKHRLMALDRNIDIADIFENPPPRLFERRF